MCDEWSFSNERKARIEFSYYELDDDGHNNKASVMRSLSGDDVDSLDAVLTEFTLFLNAMTFSYIERVDPVYTGDDDD